jgi:RHS repeat-associated protein
VNTYTYDAWNELTGLAQSGTGVSGKGVTFSYDGAGRLTGLSRFSNANLNGTGAVLSTTYTYDGADRLTGITHALPNATVVASYAYTLDAADRLTSEARTWTNPGGGTSSDTLGYTYTDNNQLTGVTHTNSSFANESFSYDSNGNRTITGYSTGTGNELMSDGTYNYTYDNEGNQVTKTAIATGNETIYTYDFRNRLVEVDQVVSGVRSVVAQYTYDALDRRIATSDGGAAIWTVYDGMSAQPLIDFNGSGNVAARYVQGPSPVGVDEVLARDTPSGGVAWYLPDRLGTLGNIVNNSGSVIDHIDYSGFGRVLIESSESNGGRFKFAGMQYDATTQLYFDRARWYDPAMGRFVRQDPIRYLSGDPNLYRYVLNSPLDSLDPSGLIGLGESVGEFVGWLGGGFVGGYPGGILGATVGVLAGGGPTGAFVGGGVGSGIGGASLAPYLEELGGRLGAFLDGNPRTPRPKPARPTWGSWCGGGIGWLGGASIGGIIGASTGFLGAPLWLTPGIGGVFGAGLARLGADPCARLGNNLSGGR